MSLESILERIAVAAEKLAGITVEAEPVAKDSAKGKPRKTTTTETEKKGAADAEVVKETKKETAKPEEKPAEKAAEKSAPEAKKYTQDDIRALLQKYREVKYPGDASGTEKVQIELEQAFKSRTIKGLNPDDYAAVVAKFSS